MVKHSFLREERLKKNKDIKAVLDQGTCYKTKSVNIYILKRSDNGFNRAGFICRKNLHQKKAVLRNRLKRVLREAYRSTKHVCPCGHDIVVLGTNLNKDTKSNILEREITDVFYKHSKKQPKILS
jgi:ribonuclease P protein component